jgi:hypothetical protein
LDLFYIKKCNKIFHLMQLAVLFKFTSVVLDVHFTVCNEVFLQKSEFVVNLGCLTSLFVGLPQNCNVCAHMLVQHLCIHGCTCMCIAYHCRNFFLQMYIAFHCPFLSETRDMEDVCM